MNRAERNHRNIRIRDAFTAGSTLKEIGEQFDISTGCVGQVLQKLQVSSRTGGAAIRAKRRAAGRHTARDVRQAATLAERNERLQVAAEQRATAQAKRQAQIDARRAQRDLRAAEQRRHRRELKEQQAACRKEHTAEILEKRRQVKRASDRRRYHRDPAKAIARARARRDANRPLYRAYKTKARSSERGRIDTRVRRLLKRVLERARRPKTSRTQMMLGYSPAEFKASIEVQFRDGMTWDNAGSVWEVDHIREVAVFLDEGVTDPAVINALSNLQPLLVGEHRAKTRSFLAQRAGNPV